MRRPLPWSSAAYWVLASHMVLGLFAFPHFAAASAGTGALYVAIGLILFGAIVLYSVLGLLGRFPGQTVVEIQRHVLTKPLTAIIHVLCAFLLTGVLAASHALFADLMATVVLQRTPKIVIALAAGLMALYGAWHGPHSLTRTLQILMPVSAALLIGAFVAALFNARWLQLIPHWTGAELIGRGIWKESYTMLALYQLLIVFGWLDVRRARPWAWGGYAVNSLVLFLCLAASIGALGVPLTAQSTWPGALAIRVVSAPGFLVERFGYMIILLWPIAHVLFQATLLLACAVGTVQSLGLPHRYLRPLMITAMTLSLILSSLFHNSAQAFAILQRYGLPLIWALILGVTWLTWALAAARKMEGPPLETWRAPQGWPEWAPPMGVPPGTTATGRQIEGESRRQPPLG
ncbi:MAG: GerAB/ArcD/ProY family transporter [Bacillota bacterium]|nr:GerAB/ArcD/ProY family transporter [Bacillota bacterium]